jgi:hypothetical protein
MFWHSVAKFVAKTGLRLAMGLETMPPNKRPKNL